MCNSPETHFVPPLPRRHWLMIVALASCAAAGCQGKGQGPLGSWMSNLFEPFKSEDPGEVARSAFDVTDADKRRRAISLFAAAPFGGSEPYLRLYRMMLGGGAGGEARLVGGPDPDATVRAAAVKALGIHGSVDDVKIIVPRLDDDVTFVRWEAAKALAKIHNRAAIRPLLLSLRENTGLSGGKDSSGESDPDVRQACAAALGQYATPAVFDGLVAALDDSNFGVAHTARQSLQTLTGYDMGNEPGDWLLWAKRHGGALFTDQESYVWQPYNSPPGLWDKMQFWKKRKHLPPRTPTGRTAAIGEEEG